MEKSKTSKRNFFARHGYETVLLLVLAAWFVFMGFANSSFVTWNNIVTVITRISEVAIIAVGMTVVIIAGGFDLSVGAIMALAPMLIGIYFGNGVPFALGIIIAFAICALLGVLNGVLIAKGRFQPIIATLATMTAIRSVVYVISEGSPITTFPKGFDQIAHGTFINIPIPILLMIAVTAIFMYIMGRTRFGRFVYATGGNPNAAKIAGINTDKVIIQTYIISAVLSAFAGLIFASRLISATADAGTNTAFDVVTAVLLGGASITGGKGNILGTIIGVLILNFIINGFNLIGVNAYWQMIFTGAVLLAVVGYDARRNLNKSVRRKKTASAQTTF